MAKDDKNLLVVAHEIKLAKILAGNNRKLRDRTLKRLGIWLDYRVRNSTVTDDVFMRIWKGLFYAMWMSDKPLLQEECAENIAKLVHLPNVEHSLLFFKCFLQTMLNEWFGIDQHRIDKFSMLVRRVLRQIFQVLKKAKWSDEYIKRFTDVLSETIFKTDNSSAFGLVLHIDEIYLEELAKVSGGALTVVQILNFVRPFAEKLARLNDIRHIKHITQHIFKYLINQTDLGIEYKEKFQAWRMQGFPGGTMDALEKIEIENGDDNDDDDDGDDDDDDDKEFSENIYDESAPKDPRAGKVDVVLPQLEFDANKLVELFDNLRFQKTTTTLARKHLTTLMEYFKKLSDGIYPLGSTTIQIGTDDGYKTDMKSSIKRLEKLEEKVNKESRKAKQKELREKKVQAILTEQIDRNQMTKNAKRDKKLKTTSNKQLMNQKPVTKNENSTKLNLHSKDSANFLKFVEKAEANLANIFNKQSKKRKQIDANTNEISVKKSKGLKVVTETEPVAEFERNSGLWVVEDFSKINEDETKPKKITDEWSKPLQNGETEYFVMKKKRKIKQHRDNNNKKSIVSNTPKTNDIVKNPFSSFVGTPKSEKKIKFSDKTHAQDFAEHLEQIKSSPGIPYDSKKKPTKPLLKPSPVVCPINPFCKKKIFKNSL